MKVVITERMLEAIQAGAMSIRREVQSLESSLKHENTGPAVREIIENSIEDKGEFADLLEGFIQRHTTDTNNN